MFIYYCTIKNLVMVGGFRVCWRLGKLQSLQVRLLFLSLVVLLLCTHRDAYVCTRISRMRDNAEQANS